MVTFKLKIMLNSEQSDMHASNAKQNFDSEDPVWVLLAELSLGDFLLDQDRGDGPTIGFLFQTVRKLGMSPGYMENMARELAEFAKEAWARTKQGRLEFAGQIRIFCQKKIIDDTTLVKPSKPYHTEQVQEDKQIFLDPSANAIGGWGYFMVERGEDLPHYSSAILHNYIDLYLYKEGK